MAQKRNHPTTLPGVDLNRFWPLRFYKLPPAEVRPGDWIINRRVGQAREVVQVMVKDDGVHLRLRDTTTRVLGPEREAVKVFRFLQGGR